MVFGLGPSELLLIALVVIILILGPKKLPELFRAMGQSVGELKKGVKESEAELKEEEEARKKKQPKRKKRSRKKKG